MPTPTLKALTTLLTLAVCTGCQARPPNSVEPVVHFAGLAFTLPAQPMVIATANQRADFLVVKYSTEPGRDYVAFSQEARIDNSCPSEAFFQAVLKPAQNTTCDHQAVAIFTQQFAHKYPAQHWFSAEHNAYYFQTDDQRKFVFIPLSADKLLKIDSDFLSEQQLRSLLGGSD